jgi:hypothetical protein
MRREGDVEYLETLLRESRHLEVRNAAEAQLRLLKARTSAATRATSSSASSG